MNKKITSYVSPHIELIAFGMIGTADTMEISKTEPQVPFSGVPVDEGEI